MSASDWDAYPGLDPIVDQSVNNAAHADLMDCKPNQRYQEPAGEPITRIGYMEQNFDDALEQILTQKYLGSYRQHMDNECWYDHRRTGFPAWGLNPSTNLNNEKDKFPIRWMYSQSEIDYNKANLEEALNRQFGGNDGYNEKMWILNNPCVQPIAGRKLITEFGK